MLVSDLVAAGYRVAGILGGPGRGVSPTELTEGVAVLNSMLDSWQSERLLVYAEVRTVFNINANQQTYTIGLAGAQLALQRPERIEKAGFLFTNVTPNIEQAFRILNVQEWASLSPKGLTSTVPYMLYYEPDIPNGTIFLWPIPTSNWQMALYTWQNLAQVTGPSQTLVLPPAYQNAMEYNLALELSVRYPERSKMTPQAVRMAYDSKMKVKSINAPTYYMQCELGDMGASRRGHWDITTNQWR